MKNVALLLAVCMVIMMFTACQGAQPSADAPAPQAATAAPAAAPAEQDEPAAEPEPPAASAPVTLTYINWNGGEEMRLQEEFIAEYTAANPHVTIEGQWITQDYESKLNTLVAAGQTPDIYYLNEYLIVEWGESGVGADLKELFNTIGVDMESRYLATALFGTGGKIYGLAPGPVTLLLYYNKPLFDEHGVDYPSGDPHNPWTWDQYIEAARKLTFDTSGNTPDSADFKPKQILTYGTSAPSSWLNLMPLLYTNGAGFGNADGSATGLSTPEGKEVLQAVADMINVHYVSPDAAISKNLPGASQLFKNNQMAMRISGTWEYQNFIAEDVDVGVAPLPMFNKPSDIAWAAGHMISASSPNQEEAAKFLYALADCENNPRQLVINFPNVSAFYSDPAKTSWLDQGNYKDDFKSIIPTIMNEIAVTPENVTLKNFNHLIGDITTAEIDKLFAGSATVDETVANIESLTAGEWQGAW